MKSKSMTLKRKLELLNAMVGETPRFPVNSIYRDGNRILATNGWQVLAFDLDIVQEAPYVPDEIPTLDAGAAKAPEKRRITPQFMRDWLSDRETQNISGPALLKFLKAKAYLKCFCCGGTGKRPVEDIEPMELVDPFENLRPIQILEVIINANLLISVLAYLDMPDELRVAKCAQQKDGEAQEMLVFYGDGWRMCQMSLRGIRPEDIEIFF